ncbi:hypothetical protein BpHYR1_042507 [Brachionus plicatilis]|uniref:Uncharacterized protein n=1 Tax=Brachionus plicatilis TaxID=10195 RepID=A0A3M7SXE9_BRAPC|nr:hypothetical protein BpHYR1_042507 [Brachionus plicatilis]
MCKNFLCNISKKNRFQIIQDAKNKNEIFMNYCTENLKIPSIIMNICTKHKKIITNFQYIFLSCDFRMVLLKGLISFVHLSTVKSEISEYLNYSNSYAINIGF